MSLARIVLFPCPNSSKPLLLLADLDETWLSTITVSGAIQFLADPSLAVLAGSTINAFRVPTWINRFIWINLQNIRKEGTDLILKSGIPPSSRICCLHIFSSFLSVKFRRLSQFLLTPTTWYSRVNSLMFPFCF
jgi:hypothetical protein